MNFDIFKKEGYTLIEFKDDTSANKNLLKEITPCNSALVNKYPLIFSGMWPSPWIRLKKREKRPESVPRSALHSF